MRLALFIAFVAGGCATLRPPASAPPVPERPPAARPPEVVQAPIIPRNDVPYPLDEAVKDALSGSWEYIGTGRWHGIHSIPACAYRNERIILVNVYCTIKDQRAFRVDVYSPTRGWARIYAEASRPISSLTKKDYFSFHAETQAPPRPEAGLPPLALTMSFPQLQRYDKMRYERLLPACYGGLENRRRRGGCLGALAPNAAAWAERNRPFLEEPPPAWYDLVRELRVLAARRR